VYTIEKHANCGGAGGVSELMSERGRGSEGARERWGVSEVGGVASGGFWPREPEFRELSAIAPAIAWACFFIKKMIPSAERGANGNRHGPSGITSLDARIERKKRKNRTGVTCGGVKLPLVRTVNCL